MNIKSTEEEKETKKISPKKEKIKCEEGEENDIDSE